MDIDIVALTKKLCQLIFTLVMCIVNIVSVAQGKGLEYNSDDFAQIQG